VSSSRRCGSSTIQSRWNWQLEEAGADPEVVLEATYGWYWAVDVLASLRSAVHLAHPLGVKGFRYRRVKNERTRRRRSGRSAADGSTCPRRGSPHRRRASWRELVRYRAKLVAIRSGLKAQIHAVLAKAGVLIVVSDLFGVTGRQRLAKAATEAPPTPNESARWLELIDILDSHEARFAAMIAERLDTHRGYQAIQQVPGHRTRRWRRCSSPRSVTCTRFTDPAQLCSWAGLTPAHRESDHRSCTRGHITKQGSNAVRLGGDRGGAAPPDDEPKSRPTNNALKLAAGKNIAKVAAARKLLTLATTGCRRRARSARSTGPGRREHSGRNRARPLNCLTPEPSAWSPASIDPRLATATTPCPHSWAKG